MKGPPLDLIAYNQNPLVLIVLLTKRQAKLYSPMVLEIGFFQVVYFNDARNVLVGEC